MELIDIYPDFGRTWKLLKVFRENKIKYYQVINNFEDYFYCGESRIDELKNNPLIFKNISRIEKSDTSVLFYSGEVYKVYLRGIWCKNKIMSLLNYDLRDIFEIDVDSVMRYTIDNIKEFEKTHYKTLFFDIETTTTQGFPDWENAIEKITLISMYNNYTNKYICYALKPDNWKEKWEEKMKYTNFDENHEILYFDDEKQMLKSFINTINSEDYDILTAWNISFDLSYIFGRCDKLGINKFELSPYKNVGVEKRMNKQDREELEIKISGRFVIDLLQRYKGVIFKEIPSYSLEYVSELELGIENKKEKILNFTDEWMNKLDNLIKYNFYDVEILVQLDKKLNLIDYLEQLRLINYAPNIYYASVAKHLIDMAILREYHDKLIMPSKQFLPKIELGGGFVKIPEPGVYNWVAVFDFSGMYPSLVQTFNLSKDTIIDKEKADFVIHEDDVLFDDVHREGFETGWSLNHVGIIPTILDNFLNTRKKIKQQMKNIDKDSIEYRDMNLRQYALKAPINANYGVNAYPGFRLYEPRVAATITYLGRKLNKYCSKRIEEDFNLRVLYADTDSFFVEIKENNKDIINKIEENINNIYVNEFIDNICPKIKNRTIKIEQDKVYKKLLLVKKRRYLGLLEEDKWIYKGVDLTRSNTPDVIKDLLLYYISELFSNKDKEMIIKECWKMLKKEKDLNKFKIPLKLSKEYTTNLPQIRAANWANKNLHTSYRQGSKFYGIYVKNNNTDIIGFENIDQLTNFNIEIDMDKYIEILKDKLLNLNDDNYKIDFNYEQTKLF